ncbi:MAG TPA: MBL fold metallo-hydrolase, partial [Thermodesulfobacteriota bacterium]|nr:MBL fold metallo-hydrolase [Thermodesulfobacteriota bacterium]
RRLARRLAVAAATLLAAFPLAAVALVALTGFALSGPRYRGPVSDHFDGRRFFNQVHKPRGTLEVLRWRLTRRPAPWPARIEAPPGPPPPARVGRGELRVTFVGHATTLVQMDRLNVLTDPHWSERASPVSWAGPRRVRPPGIPFEALPPVDLVVISHNHYDHLDLPTLERLAARHAPRILVPLGNRPLLASAGIGRVEELDWWQGVEVAPGVRAHLVPAQHFSARGLFDRNATLWGGFVLEGPAGVVYFAGDTGFGPHVEQIRARFGPPRLALLPIGAYEPRWFMAYTHMSPEEAVAAHRILGAGTSVAIHFGTFPLADEPFDEPVARLARALEAARVPAGRFWVLEAGEGRAVPPLEEAGRPGWQGTGPRWRGGGPG